MTSRAAEKNSSNSVLPGGATATEDEIDAAMKKQKDLPVGNSKEERKKGALYATALVHIASRTKKKYISALETKVKEQNEQLLHLGKIIQAMNMQLQSCKMLPTRICALLVHLVGVTPPYRSATVIRDLRATALHCWGVKAMI